MSGLTFGIGPAGHDSWEPNVVERFRGRISDLLGQEVSTRVTTTYLELLEELSAGGTQLAWLPPAIFARAEEVHGGRLLAVCTRVKTPGYRGVLFVRADSSIASPDDLSGSTVAWVDPASSAGYLYPRWSLLQRGIDPERIFREQRMLGTHGAVVRAVSEGDVDVGATYLNLGPSTREPTVPHSAAGWTGKGLSDDFRPVLMTPIIPNDVICASKELSPSKGQEITAALFQFHETEDGAAILRDLFQADRFGPGRSADYATVRAAFRLIP